MQTLIVALNPSIDVEWRVDHVAWEEKNNVQGERRWAGGKGINVARWLRWLGGSPVLLLPAGGATGEELVGYLRAEDLSAETVPLREATRANIIVTTSQQGQMRFNPPGPVLSAREWRAFLQRYRVLLRRAALVVLSGSLPRGVPAGAYATLLDLAREAKVRALLDCDGIPFREAVAARPFLVKPNEHELAGWSGRTLNGVAALRREALRLSAVTQGWVLVSCGARGARLWHAAEEVEFYQPARRVRVRNTVGAGDALLAGVALALQKQTSPAGWLRAGVRWGSAATACAAGQLPRRLGLRRHDAALSSS